MQDFYKNKYVLITGASSGIGAEMALQLAAMGARLALFARRRDKLEALVGPCKSAGAPEVLALPGDTTQRGDIANAMKAMAGWARLDIAFLNAGGGRDMPVERFSAQLVEEVMQLNYMGAVYWLEPLLARMREQKGGVVAMTGSIAGDRGMPRYGPYGAAKAALRTLNESIRADAASYGIRTVLVEPGFVKSELTARNQFRMPFLMETADGARAVLSGVAAGKRVVRFPLPVDLTSRLYAMLPGSVADRISRRMFAKLVKRDT